MNKLTISLNIRSFFHKSIFRIKPFMLLYVLVFHTSCIDKFMPYLSESEQILVVDGSIIKENEIQRIIISKSSPVNTPKYNPVQSCIVTVNDNHGNKFEFHEAGTGIYEAIIPEEYLVYGTSFQLNITTSGNKRYQSNFEPLLPSSKIDSIYYQQDYYQNFSESYSEGIQFYTDLKIPEGGTKYYRWKLTETYEYHSRYYIDAMWDCKLEQFIYFLEPNDSLKVCWKESDVKSYFTSTTENLTANIKLQIPLNYVPRVSEKLNVRYSLLVKQYSLSESAYRYWDRNKILNQESGGLYQSQPSRSISNIRNINDSEEIVLGFFWVSSYTEKRVFFEGPLGDIYRGLNCTLLRMAEDYYGVNRNKYFAKSEDMNGDEYLGVPRSPECIDCTARGGTTTKPAYWK